MTDIREKLASLKPGEVGIIYIGQAGFILSSGGVTAFVDPYLSYSVDHACEKGDGLWTRRYAPPILPEEADFADYVFVSHDHLDHADPETLRGIAGANPSVKIVCGSAIADAVEGYCSADVIGAYDGWTVNCTEFQVKVIPAAHEEIHRDSRGDPTECGFIFDFGKVKVYHAGDSLVYDGLCDTVRGVDVMLLPVNGNGFYRRADNIVGNMDAYDAARLASDSAAKLMIPMHFDLYEGNSVPECAVKAIVAAAAPSLDCRIPTPGCGYVIADGKIREL